MERTKTDRVHMAPRYQMLCRAVPRRGSCLPLSCSAGCDGTRSQGREVALRFGAQTSSLSITRERADSRALHQKLGGWGSALTQRLCDSLGEPELTKVGEVMWPGGVSATGLHLLVEFLPSLPREVGRHCRRRPPPWLWDWLEAPDHFWRGWCVLGGELLR